LANLKWRNHLENLGEDVELIFKLVKGTECECGFDANGSG